MKRILYILAIALSILACTDEIDKSNRFTFTGETMADFLLNRSEKYSHFIKLLKRANLLSLLNTYGQYTLFLPDNEAVEKFVAEQDSIYQFYKDSNTPIWTGITSPLIEELSDSMANVIARTHLVEAHYTMADMNEGALQRRNFNNRLLGVNYVVGVEHFCVMINNRSAIVGGDNLVENGAVHIIDRVINPSAKSVPGVVAEYPFFSLFDAALRETGFGDSLQQYNDYGYKMGGLLSPAPPNFMSSANVRNPQTKFYKYTGFVEPDEVFHSRGIYTIDDLAAFAARYYGTEDNDNPRSPRNALHRFVAYHFVPRELPYNDIVFHNRGSGSVISEDIMSTVLPRSDYFETMAGLLLKATKPYNTQYAANIYINYSGNENATGVRVVELTEFIRMNELYAKFNQNALNGIVHPIDGILVYDEDRMTGAVLNERLRFDVATLIPELSCNGERFTRYGGVTHIPAGYSNSIRFNSTGNTLYYEAESYGKGYMADYFLLANDYDISFRIPPVPQRNYEVRFGYSVTTSGYVQIYIDNLIADRPIDLTLTADNPKIGYIDDESTYDNGTENDKAMRNLGYMKAPDIFKVYGEKGLQTARSSDLYLRKIVACRHFDNGDHWIRFKNVGDDTRIPFHLDYIELVPLHIVSDPTKPEDRH